jgi:hypothetical protein
MSGGAVDACGNCGAPLELDDDGRCRWCRVKAQATHPHVHRADGRRPVGATLVKADHYQAVDLTLHVIYGHLTWMATYEPQGSNPSFAGIGFV